MPLPCLPLKHPLETHFNMRWRQHPEWEGAQGGDDLGFWPGETDLHCVVLNFRETVARARPWFISYRQQMRGWRDAPNLKEPVCGRIELPMWWGWGRQGRGEVMCFVKSLDPSPCLHCLLIPVGLPFLSSRDGGMAGPNSATHMCQ